MPSRTWTIYTVSFRSTFSNSNNYQYLRSIAGLLDLFSISYSTLNLSSVTDKCQRNLFLLIDTMVFGKDAPNIINAPGKYRFVIANISLLTLIYINQNGKVIIDNIANLEPNKYRLVPKNKEGQDEDYSIAISPLVMLTSEDIISSTNINPEILKEGIRKIEYSNEYATWVVELLLNIIYAYDKVKVVEYLHSALEICMWLKEHDPTSPIHLINEYQIYHRQRELREEEIGVLQSLIETLKYHDEYPMLLCAIYLLLDDIAAFEFHFNQLPDEQRKLFVCFPIYILYNQKKGN